MAWSWPKPWVRLTVDLADKRAAAVALTGVDAPLQVAGTEHLRSEGVLVEPVAQVAWQDGHDGRRQAARECCKETYSVQCFSRNRMQMQLLIFFIF